MWKHFPKVEVILLFELRQGAALVRSPNLRVNAAIRRCESRPAETRVSPNLRQAIEPTREPADAGALPVVECRDVRLDVEERRPVEHVHVLDLERGAVDAHQPNGGEPERVGPCG